MSFIRIILILGFLLHPFCGHCLAELRSAFERSEVMVGTNDFQLDSENNAPEQQTVCTKLPCIKSAKIDLKSPVSDLEIGRFLPHLMISFSVEESVDFSVQQSLPLYLQLSVIRI